MPELDLRCDGPPNAEWTVILAHGAGQGMGSEFMEYFTKGLAARGIRVLRFEFPYMRQTGLDGKRRSPNPEPVLRGAWQEAIRMALRGGASKERLIIGGKSLGGRIASLIADEESPAGLVCLGYPFHPPGRPERLRTAHLEEIKTRTLICQGARDTFGNEAEVGGYGLSPRIRVRWLPDGDHSFKPRKGSGSTAEQHRALALQYILAFLQELSEHRSP